MGCLSSKDEPAVGTTQQRAATPTTQKQTSDGSTAPVSKMDTAPLPNETTAAMDPITAESAIAKPMDAADRFKQIHGVTPCDPNKLISGLSGASAVFSASSTGHNSDEAAAKLQQHMNQSPAPFNQTAPESAGGVAALKAQQTAPGMQSQRSDRNLERARIPPTIGIAPEELLKDVQHLTWLGQGGYGAVYQGVHLKNP